MPKAAKLKWGTNPAVKFGKTSDPLNAKGRLTELFQSGEIDVNNWTTKFLAATYPDLELTRFPRRRVAWRSIPAFLLLLVAPGPWTRPHLPPMNLEVARSASRADESRAQARFYSFVILLGYIFSSIYSLSAHRHILLIHAYYKSAHTMLHTYIHTCNIFFVIQYILHVLIMYYKSHHTTNTHRLA